MISKLVTLFTAKTHISLAHLILSVLESLQQSGHIVGGEGMKFIGRK